MGLRIAIFAEHPQVVCEPSQLVIFQGDLEQPVSGSAVGKRIRFGPRRFCTRPPVFGIMEWAFGSHANEHAIRRPRP